MPENHSPLTARSVERLLKLCAMFMSDHDGEAVNALRSANRVLAGHGLTWPEFLAMISAGSDASIYETKTGISDHQRAAAHMLEADDIYTDWELTFLGSVQQFSDLSFKQTVVFDRLWRKFEEHCT